MEFKQSNDHLSATVISNLDADLAYSNVKEFVTVYNSVTSTLKTLSQRGLEGEESGVLSRDVGITSIRNKLRSLVSSNLAGFGQMVVTFLN